MWGARDELPPCPLVLRCSAASSERREGDVDRRRAPVRLLQEIDKRGLIGCSRTSFFNSIVASSVVIGHSSVLHPVDHDSEVV
jgi:hypothetical protein